MKAVASLFVAGFVITSGWCQGTLQFANTASSNFRLWTNNPTGSSSNLMSGQNAFRIGLFVSTNLNASEEALEFVALTTNAASSAVAGYFNGGIKMVPGATTGTQIRFQVRVWTFGAGMSWTEATAAAAVDPLNVKLAKSMFGYTTLGGDTNVQGQLFGTLPGQLARGFQIPNFIYSGFSKITRIARGPNGILTFDVSSTVGPSYRLYQSANLETWIPGPRYSYPSGTWSFSVTNSGVTPYLFFKLASEP